MNVDTRFRLEVQLALAIEAGLRSVDNQPVNNEALREAGGRAVDLFNDARQRLLGDPDMKPVGG